MRIAVLKTKSLEEEAILPARLNSEAQRTPKIPTILHLSRRFQSERSSSLAIGHWKMQISLRIRVKCQLLPVLNRLIGQWSRIKKLPLSRRKLKSWTRKHWLLTSVRMRPTKLTVSLKDWSKTGIMRWVRRFNRPWMTFQCARMKVSLLGKRIASNNWKKKSPLLIEKLNL